MIGRKARVLSLLAFAWTLTTTGPVSSQEPLTVETQSGVIVGTSDDGIEAWQAVPYAAPPLGPLRWRPPQPVQPWQKPLKTNGISASCAQNADLGIFAHAGGSEDCLYLNVYRSAESKAEQKKPVFVWIHGGALQVGQGGDYEPRKLAREGKAIVVTFSYRLGIFGFLSHPAIDAEACSRERERICSRCWV